MVAFDIESVLRRGQVLAFRPASEPGFIAWRRELEAVRSARGARCLTPHVSETDWLGHFVAGRCAIEALDRELASNVD